MTAVVDESLKSLLSDDLSKEERAPHKAGEHRAAEGATGAAGGRPSAPRRTGNDTLDGSEELRKDCFLRKQPASNGRLPHMVGADSLGKFAYRSI